jgi:predicted 2-oxoglutarate/Fe(II)-dependent dioxygenase YbiX
MSGILYPGRLLPDATVAGCIDIFENAWPDPYGTIEMMEAACTDPESGVAWTRATTIGQGINQKARTNYHLGITDSASQGSSTAQNIHNQMYMLLLAATVPYTEKHDVHQLWHEPYNMLRYRGGQEYKAHYDGGTETGRCVSAIVYLNNDYEGGHVEFTNFGVKIKPEPGMLLLFPSNYAYTHIAHPVISGTKYAIVTWMHDRPGLIK